MIRHLGYPCMNLTLGDTKSRTMRIQNFTLQAASDAALANVMDLGRMIAWNAENNVKFFRMPSEIFPYQDHPTLGYALRQLRDHQFIKRLLRDIGALANQHQIRITCHPGPFTILSSSNEKLTSKSLAHIENMAQVASLLGTADFAVNIHIGRSRSSVAADAFVSNFARLSPLARGILTLENDDKDNCWSVEDLMPIHTKCGVPIVSDLHHWRFCRRSSMPESARLALSTWGNRFPKMHYSESAQGSNPRAHSAYIENRLPEFYGSAYDVMLETKAKDWALLRYRRMYG